MATTEQGARPHPGPLDERAVLGQLAALVPTLRERAAETEQLRQVPEPMVAAIIGTGWVGAFRPVRYGGSQLGLGAIAHGARILAQGCASTAWSMVFLAQHAWMLGKLPDDLQEEIFAEEPLPLIAGALAAVGTARRVDGGFLVSGRSEWNSAIRHSTWASMKAVAEDKLLVFYLPVRDVQLQDVWHTAGMRGTNSDSFVADHVFVSERLAVPMRVLGAGDAGGRHPEQPFVDYPYISVVSITCSAVMLGATEAAVQFFEDKMRSRVLAFSGDIKQVDQPLSQMRLGEVVTKLRMARALWQSCIDRLDDTYGAGRSLSIEERIEIRSSSALVVQTCRDVVSTVMNAAGGSSYFLTADLQRIQRDTETLKAHAMFDWDRVAQLQGRSTLGIPPAPTDLI